MKTISENQWTYLECPNFFRSCDEKTCPKAKYEIKHLVYYEGSPSDDCSPWTKILYAYFDQNLNLVSVEENRWSCY